MSKRYTPTVNGKRTTAPKCIKPPANGKPWTIQCDACGSKYLIGTTEDCHVKAAHIGASVLRCPHCGRKADIYEASVECQPWVA